jgi:putative selenate reductase
MKDKFNPVSIYKLLQIFLNEDTNKAEFLGIPKTLFFHDKPNPQFTNQLFGQTLDFPLGVAAGPHSQLAQNIISAWLCGARYIELKTIQTLDELEVEKPCIDMQDEGYNCEWSQELKIEQTFDQYLDAWILLHVIDHKLGTQAMKGTIFNMSVGYNLEGIMKENVQWFFNKMANCKAEKEQKIAEIKALYPEIEQIDIPNQIANSITLSTMHGCPPDEIENIAAYLISNKKLHTYIKLNPTLLGATELRKILNETGHFSTHIPDEAFVHDLKYDDAVPMIERLIALADENKVSFGLKLTNTLESINHKNVFTKTEMMYMSGRALHPISVNVAKKLQNQFKGKLALSFSGGADAFNFPELIACGLGPVTVSTDLLKPGGYTRLLQYYSELKQQMEAVSAFNLNDYISKRADKLSLSQAALHNLTAYAHSVLHSNAYQRTYFKSPNIKGKRKLGFFDCIQAPCRENCATSQNIPDYLYYTAQNDFDSAYMSILKTNPQPGITGNICDHQCQLRCTRINYDDPVLIREVKRFVEENHSQQRQKPLDDNGLNVGIIGAGPSGLSAAYYLRLAGFQVEIFEASAKAGGMVAHAVPEFRLSDAKIQNDVQRLVDLGVTLHYQHTVDAVEFQNLYTNYDYLYIATGAPVSSKLNIKGIDAQGVMEPLSFLFDAKKGLNSIQHKKVAIIGGGNTAMDAARVALRLSGKASNVTVLYRRTLSEMPADLGEIRAVLEEGVNIMELTAPEEILLKNGAVSGIRCAKMTLIQDKSTIRPNPVKLEGSEFNLDFDLVIPAVGQDVFIDFIDKDLFKPHPNTHEIRLKRVFTGGDVMHGAATAIKAIGDGRRVAEHIARLNNIQMPEVILPEKQHDYISLLEQRAVRLKGKKIVESPLSDRISFNPVGFTLTKEDAVAEASRCLNCDEICNICVTVCPNRANYSYQVKPESIQLYKAIRNKNEAIIVADKIFNIQQKYQILNIADFCNECGNCETFCPTNGAPYKDKPKFYLSIQSFNQSEEGYYLSKLPKNRTILIFKEHGGIRTLELTKNEWLYETDHVKATFNTSDFKLEHVDFKVPCAQQVHFDMAAEMKILYQAASNLY